MKVPTEAPVVNGRERPSERTETGVNQNLQAAIAHLRREISELRETVATPDVTEFLTVEKVAELLELSERSVRSYVSSGELPSVQFGRARRIPVDGLRDFIQEQLEASE